ncbi:MAG TPA: hypothetical protein VGE40_11965, partial [Bacilli bacterium]
MKVLGKSSLAKKVMIWIAIIMFPLALLIASADLYIYKQLTENDRLMADNLEELFQTQNLQKNYLLLVSDDRAYLAYGKDEFLEDSQEHYQAVQTNYNTLKEGFGPNDKEKVDSFDKINALGREYLTLITQGIEMKKAGDTDNLSNLSDKTTPMIIKINDQFVVIGQIQET